MAKPSFVWAGSSETPCAHSFDPMTAPPMAAAPAKKPRRERSKPKRAVIEPPQWAGSEWISEILQRRYARRKRAVVRGSSGGRGRSNRMGLERERVRRRNWRGDDRLRPLRLPLQRRGLRCWRRRAAGSCSGGSAATAAATTTTGRDLYFHFEIVGARFHCVGDVPDEGAPAFGFEIFSVEDHVGNFSGASKVEEDVLAGLE